jgi:hypothetical protein
MQSTNGSFTYINDKKKTRCSWNGSVVKKQNKTFKVKFSMNINKDRMVLDVDASANKDATVNIHGDMTTTKNGKTVKKPIHLDHYKIQNMKEPLIT